MTNRPTGSSEWIAKLVSLRTRKRRICTPAWLTAASYAQLFETQRPSILWLHEPQRLPPNTELLFPELATQEMLDHHSRRQPELGRIGLACLPNAFVSGHSLVGTGSHLYQMAPITPLFVDQLLADSHLVGDRKLSGKSKRFVPGASALLTNWNSYTYGHWLLEGMPKLLLLKRIASQLPPLRVILPASLPAWVSEWIELLLPKAAIERYEDASEYLVCELLLMPTLLSSPEHFPHPELGRLLEDLRPFHHPTANHSGELFVSRVAPNPFRELVNQAEIEQIASDHGLTLIKPETLTIPEQIARFAHARLVVGEFGSAMHNTLFSPMRTHVFCLNWINPLQSHIGRLKHHHVGYLLPSGGKPATYALGQARVEFHIEPHTFRECLQRLIERRGQVS